MKVFPLFKIIAKEFKKDIFISIFLLVLADFIYVNFTGVHLNRESGLILWQGGNDTYLFNLSTVILKILNVSIVFITVGKIIDKLSSDIMVYILARITNYNKLICAYTIVVIMLGESGLTISHIIYYCFVGFYFEQATACLLYLLMDALGFCGMIIIYIILSNCYLVENSYLYIIAIYILNTVLPVPILLAMSTVRFLILKTQVPIILLLLLVAGMDFILIFLYYKLIKRRRINVC